MTDSTLLSLSDVGKHYGSVTALTGVDLTLQAGEILALLGHNGAGKTTLMKIILGLTEHDSGSVSVLGRAAGESNHAIGYVPENVNFYPSLSGMETLVYFARLNGLTKKHAQQVAGKRLDQVHLDSARHRPVKEYSKGMKQRLGLAQALLPFSPNGSDQVSPKLLILDEPTVGLDPIATREFYLLLAQLQQRGCGIIICTHVLPGLESVIDTAFILNKGQQIVSGTIDDLVADAALPIVIKPTGLNGSLTSDPMLNQYLTQNGLLEVPPTEKLKVISQLMVRDGLCDLQMSSPSLQDLYHHYMTRSEV